MIYSSQGLTCAEVAESTPFHKRGGKIPVMFGDAPSLNDHVETKSGIILLGESRRPNYETGRGTDRRVRTTIGVVLPHEQRHPGEFRDGDEVELRGSSFTRLVDDKNRVVMKCTDGYMVWLGYDRLACIWRNGSPIPMAGSVLLAPIPVKNRPKIIVLDIKDPDPDPKWEFGTGTVLAVGLDPDGEAAGLNTGDTVVISQQRGVEMAYDLFLEDGTLIREYPLSMIAGVVA